MSITIEKNVPLPPKNVGGPSRYPFEDMDSGDSFEVKVKKSGCKNAETLRASLIATARRVLGPGQVTVRMSVDGVRVWRL